jgi:hypothetical protein
LLGYRPFVYEVGSDDIGPRQHFFWTAQVWFDLLTRRSRIAQAIRKITSTRLSRLASIDRFEVEANKSSMQLEGGKRR